MNFYQFTRQNIAWSIPLLMYRSMPCHFFEGICLQVLAHSVTSHASCVCFFSDHSRFKMVFVYDDASNQWVYDGVKYIQSF